MRSTWAKMALVAVLATTALASGSRAMAQQASDQLVYVDLKDADMVTATRTLTMKTGVQFVFKQSDTPFKKVTLKLNGVTAEDAVRYICQAAGAYFKRDDAGVFIISHDAPEVTTKVEPAKVKPLIVRKIKVLKASGQEVLDSIVFGMARDSASGFAALKRFSAIAGPSLQRHMSGTDTSALLNGSFQQYNAASARPVQPATGGESGSDIRLPGEQANQMGGVGRGGFSGGGNNNFGGGGNNNFGGGGNNNFGGGNGNNFGGNGNGNASMIGGQGLVGDSINYISYDPTDNSFVVRGTEEDIAQLQTYINMFDVAPRQVLIKVEFITTTADNLRSLGYSFQYARGTMVTGFTPTILATGGSSVGLSYATGNLAMRLRALLSENSGTTVSAPILRTLNNQPAEVQIVTYNTIFIPQTVLNNNQSLTTYVEQQIQIPTELIVNPRINDDDTITMALTPQISNITSYSTSPDGTTTVPNYVQQALAVTCRVRNGETIVLAGFTDKSDSFEVQRVPILSDLPIIGQFFRATNRRHTSSELLVFVTPTILDEDTTGNPGGP